MYTLNETYNQNESANNHIENSRLVVKAFGTERELEIIESIIRRKGETPSYSLNLFNTIINTGLKYENLRLSEGDELFIVDGEIIAN